MFELLIVILCFWLGWKLLRWWIIRKIQRDSRKIYEQFTGQRPNEQRKQQQSPRKGGWQHAQKSKKYQRDEGEYVAFEDIKVTFSEESTSKADGSSQRSSTTVEQQIVDAEWEEI